MATRRSYVHNSMVKFSRAYRKLLVLCNFLKMLMVSDKTVHRAFRSRRTLWTKPIREIFHFHSLPKLYIGFKSSWRAVHIHTTFVFEQFYLPFWSTVMPSDTEIFDDIFIVVPRILQTLMQQRNLAEEESWRARFFRWMIDPEVKWNGEVTLNCKWSKQVDNHHGIVEEKKKKSCCQFW